MTKRMWTDEQLGAAFEETFNALSRPTMACLFCPVCREPLPLPKTDLLRDMQSPPHYLREEYGQVRVLHDVGPTGVGSECFIERLLYDRLVALTKLAYSAGPTPEEKASVGARPMEATAFARQLLGAPKTLAIAQLQIAHERWGLRWLLGMEDGRPAGVPHEHGSIVLTIDRAAVTEATVDGEDVSRAPVRATPIGGASDSPPPR